MNAVRSVGSVETPPAAAAHPVPAVAAGSVPVGWTPAVAVDSVPAVAVGSVPVDSVPAVAVSGWLPRSPCGEGCLSPPGAVPSVGWPRRAARLAAAAVLLLAGVAIALCYPVLGPAARQRLVRGWSRALLLAFGVRLRITGAARFAPPGSGALIVVNHVSWLDIVVLNAIQPSRMVAKRELRDWPVIGRLATSAGTLYIDRERLSTLPRTVAAMTAALRAGDSLTVFPEGTTRCGRELGPYRRASFQAALDAGVIVSPVVLRFRLAHDGSPTTAPAFVGEGTLLASLCRVAALRGLTVEAEVLPALAAADHPDRRALASATQQAAATALTPDMIAVSGARTAVGAATASETTILPVIGEEYRSGRARSTRPSSCRSA